MFSNRSPFLCACLLLLVPALAAADEVSLVEWAKERVEQGIVRPVAQHETSRFARSRPPPHQRRVRILESKLQHDKNGKGFLPFIIDVRYDQDWQNDIEGCVYQGSGDLFVKVGDAYRPAAFLLGKDVDPVPGVCQVVPES